MEDEDVPAYVLVWLRIRKMHDRERLHWLHRVRGYKKLTNNIISVGTGKNTKSFKFPVVLGEDAG